MTKTNNLILGGLVLASVAVGAVAWILNRRGDVDVPQDTTRAGAVQALLNGQEPEPLRNVAPVRTTDGRTAQIQNVSQGRDFVNSNFGALQFQGKTLERLQDFGGRVAVKGVGGTFGAGTISNIRNARDLSQFETKFLGTRTPAENAAGLSKFDRQILKNVGLDASNPADVAKARREQIL